MLYRLAAVSDVFLTNKLPRVRRDLGIDVDDIRAHNPNIVYVRGSGYGPLGPDADRGGYDILGYWSRSGVGAGATPPGSGPLHLAARPGVRRLDRRDDDRRRDLGRAAAPRAHR